MMLFPLGTCWVYYPSFNQQIVVDFMKWTLTKPCYNIFGKLRNLLPPQSPIIAQSIYTVRCLGSPGQKCVTNDNDMKNVVFAVAKGKFLHVALYCKNVHLRGSIFFRPRRRISIDVITSTMQNAEIAFYWGKTS